jgi:hypothetical protein
VRFANALDGWAFDPGLFATSDGARTWQPVNLGGPVLSLATAGGYVDAVVASCTPAASCTGRFRLEQARASGGPFTTVLTSPSSRVAGGVDLSLQPPAGFVAFPGLYATDDLANSSSWHTFPSPCAALKDPTLSSIVEPTSTSLYSLCSGNGAAGSSTKVVVFSRDGKSTVSGDAPFTGDGGVITATPSGILVIATSSGASWLDRSTDGGRTWSSLPFLNDGGIGFRDLGFTTNTQGVVIHGKPELGSAGVDQLLMTRNAGASWQAISFG